MGRKGLWEVAAREYRRLKRKWQGPDTAIYIFPVAQFHLPSRTRQIVKSGLSFRRCLFLFLAPDVPDIEIKALLAHEYNHICRLAETKYKADEMPLKEALVMEGLAEYAVKEMYGEKQVSHWTKRYRERDILRIWNRHFLPELELKGQENHQPYLYGKSGPLPEWIGYQIGYEIVEGFQKQSSYHSMSDLLRLSADKLIAGSFFRM
nr:DUF2268 domain-containing putative Zn-dependent protease [Thalassobacillus devorans]